MTHERLLITNENLRLLSDRTMGVTHFSVKRSAETVLKPLLVYAQVTAVSTLTGFASGWLRLRLPLVTVMGRRRYPCITC